MMHFNKQLNKVLHPPVLNSDQSIMRLNDNNKMKEKMSNQKSQKLEVIIWDCVVHIQNKMLQM